MNNETESLISQLNLSDRKLSKGHRKIADYIEQHYDKAVLLTASSLSEAVGVSESTVVRFAVALGYEGYPEMHRALQEAVRHRLTANQRFDMAADIREDDVMLTVLKTDMSNIRATIDEMDQVAFRGAVSALLEAKHIYILGLRSAAPLAQFLGYYLNFIFDNVRVVAAASNDVYEGIVRVGKGDVLIGISFPRYSTRTLEAMRFAKKNEAQVIALTDGEMSPLCKASDICLTARTNMASFVDSLAAPLSLINALIIAVGLHKRDELSLHLTRLEGIWSEHSVYLEEHKK